MENSEHRIKVPTTGVSDFPSLILGGKGKYVDKTDLLCRLANDADQQLFISHPRRFGKSLMLSPLKAMFEGRRELFNGLAIDKLPWEGWEQPTPVYGFTMAKVVCGTYELFREQLAKLVKCLRAQTNVEYTGEGNISEQFDDFLVAEAKKSPVGKIVVLIDEYNEPVAKFLDGLETLNRVRSDLLDFYEKLKVTSEPIRFLMMTGVTKLTELSMFPGSNYPTNISTFQSSMRCSSVTRRKSWTARFARMSRCSAERTAWTSLRQRRRSSHGTTATVSRPTRRRAYAIRYLSAARSRLGSWWVTGRLVGLNFNPKKCNIDMPVIGLVCVGRTKDEGQG